jgi:hypothetical protein
VVVLTPLPLVVIANAAVGRRWAHLAIGILAGLSAGVTFLIGAIDLSGAARTTGGSGQNSTGVDIGIMITAVVAAALASKPLRERVARVLPVDPDNPVHSLALVLAVLLFGTQVTSILFTNVTPADQPPLTLGDLLAQELPFLILAAAGVGLFMRRNLPQAALRVGLVMPTWWQVVVALAAAGVFFAFGQAMDGHPTSHGTSTGPRSSSLAASTTRWGSQLLRWLRESARRSCSGAHSSRGSASSPPRCSSRRSTPSTGCHWMPCPSS